MIWWLVVVISIIAGLLTWWFEGYFLEGLMVGVTSLLGLALGAVAITLVIYVFQIGLTSTGTERVEIDSVVIEGVTTDADFEKVDSDGNIFYREVESGKLKEISRTSTVVKTDDTATGAYVLKEEGEYNGFIKFVFDIEGDTISSEIFLPTLENKEKAKELETEESSADVYDLWE